MDIWGQNCSPLAITAYSRRQKAWSNNCILTLKQTTLFTLEFLLTLPQCCSFHSCSLPLFFFRRSANALAVTPVWRPPKWSFRLRMCGSGWVIRCTALCLKKEKEKKIEVWPRLGLYLPSLPFYSEIFHLSKNNVHFIERETDTVFKMFSEYLQFASCFRKTETFPLSECAESITSAHLDSSAVAQSVIYLFIYVCHGFRPMTAKPNT